MLTKKQKEILDFINKFIDKNDYSPSYEEIAKHFKLKSVSTIHEHIANLKKQGYLTKQKKQPRTLGIKNIKIPLLGTIAAGSPIEAIETKEEIEIEKSMVSNPRDHYALKVKGNSMIDEGVFDGDIAILRRQSVAENGEKVVAIINGNEATLKKIYKEKEGFRLQPANSSMKPIFVKELEVRGKLIGVKRYAEIRSIQEERSPVNRSNYKTNQIICGDVLDEMRKIPNNFVHLAITSPPYNVGKDYDSHHDQMTYKDYLDWLEKIWVEVERVLVPGGRFALNIAPTGIKDFVPIHHDFANQFKKIGMKFRTEIIWYKQTMLKRTAWGSFKSPSNPHIVPSWEYVLIFSKDQDKLDGNVLNADITKEEFMKFSDGFWHICPETKRKGHPAPFPEELIYRLIKFYSFKDNVILDMFGGTGTVAAVSAKTNRRFIHIDISETYCEISKNRVDEALKVKK